jgi:CHAT domain-containing protein
MTKRSAPVCNHAWHARLRVAEGCGRRLLRVALLLSASFFLAGGPACAQDDPEPALDEEGQTGAAIEAARGVLEQTLPPGASREEKTRYLVARERAAFTVGDGKARLDALRRLVDLHKGTPRMYRYWAFLWREELRAGNQARAFAMGEEIASSTGFSVAARAEHAAQLALDYYAVRERERAWDAFARAAGLLAEMGSGAESGRVDRVTAIVEYTRSNLLRYEGRYADAEGAIRIAQRANARAIEQSRHAPKSDVAVSMHESNVRWRWYIQSSYLTLLTVTGRHVEAETVARQGLQDAIADQTVGATLAFWYTRIAQARIAQRQFADAQALTERALAVLAKAGYLPSSQEMLRARTVRLESLLGQEKWSDADAEYKTMLSATADDSVARQSVANPVLRAALAAANGRGLEAQNAIDPILRFRERNWGEKNPATVDAKLVRAMAYQAQGLTRFAVSAYREAFGITFAADAVRTDAGSSGLRGFYFPMALRSFMRLVAEQAAAGEVAPELAADAFVAADRLRDSVVQQAVIDAATRTIVAGNSDIAALVRREQDIRNARRDTFAAMNRQFAELRQVDQRLKELREKQGDAAKAKAAKTDAEVEAVRAEVARVQAQREALNREVETLRKRAAVHDDEQRGVREEMSARFPAYSRLVNPPPVRPADVAKRLAPGEALLGVHSSATHTFVWAIPARGEPVLRVVPTGAAAVAADVAKLRDTLELADRADPAPFDSDTAHRLYRTLIEPVAGTLSGARVVTVVAGGALGRIPFAVLLREPAAAADYGAAAWLVRDMALAHAASASAWISVRDTAAAAKPDKPFIGFGDPQFSPAVAGVAPKAVRAAVTAPLAKRAAEGPAAAFDYGSIPPLPETREEILAIAKSLSADPATTTFFGTAASREKVLSTDLRDRRVLAFATHGLRAGDLPNLSQPALAMAATVKPDESPLLTLDDILKLQLGADWVVLSACNTAAADGSSEEAISGLGRGFFFAGARSMLVTHWAVETLSAQALVTGVFGHQAANPGAARAESLRQSQLQMIAGKSGAQHRHPFFWSPYVLVGDPLR